MDTSSKTRTRTCSGGGVRSPEPICISVGVHCLRSMFCFDLVLSACPCFVRSVQCPWGWWAVRWRRRWRYAVTRPSVGRGWATANWLSSTGSVRLTGKLTRKLLQSIASTMTCCWRSFHPGADVGFVRGGPKRGGSWVSLLRHCCASSNNTESQDTPFPLKGLSHLNISFEWR